MLFAILLKNKQTACVCQSCTISSLCVPPNPGSLDQGATRAWGWGVDSHGWGFQIVQIDAQLGLERKREQAVEDMKPWRRFIYARTNTAAILRFSKYLGAN